MNTIVRSKHLNLRVDVTFVGLRSWHDCPSRSQGRYAIGLCFGDLRLQSGLTGRAFGHSLNMLDPFKSGYVQLPEQLDYWPSLYVQHLDCAPKVAAIVGAATVVRSGRYLIDDVADRTAANASLACVLSVKSPPTAERSEQQPLLRDALDSEQRPTIGPQTTASRLARLSRLLKAKLGAAIRSQRFARTNATHSESPQPPPLARLALSSQAGFTWWTKYYNSVPLTGAGDEGDRTQKHRLRVLDAELEAETELGGLRDWADRVEMLPVLAERPRRSTTAMRRKAYAVLKVDVKVRRCTEAFRCYSLNRYVVAAHCDCRLRESIRNAGPSSCWT